MSHAAQPAARKAWHAEDIKAEIRKKGQSLTGLALSAGLNECDCRDVFRNHRPAAERVIARFIKVPANELWPDRYSRSESSTIVDTPARGAAHRQNAGAR